MSESTEIAPVSRGPGRWAAFAEFWHYFSMNRGAVVGLVVFALLVLVAIFANFLAPHSPDQQYRDALLIPPMWEAGGRPDFILGTDPVGRDMLSRLIHGSRYSLFIGLVVVTGALFIGVILGVLAGYFRGWVDVVIMRVMDIILVLQPHFARLTRAAVMAEKNREYVTSARLAGASHFRLMLITILPNCLGPLIVQATLSFSNAILEAAALGFLGMGAQPPTPEWGTMLASAREFILRAPWVVTYPGLAILITVLAINLIGDGLRDALDPKLKRS